MSQVTCELSLSFTVLGSLTCKHACEYTRELALSEKHNIF